MLTTSKQSTNSAVRFLSLNVPSYIRLNIVLSALFNLLISFTFIAYVAQLYIKYSDHSPFYILNFNLKGK